MQCSINGAKIDSKILNGPQHVNHHLIFLFGKFELYAWLIVKNHIEGRFY